MRLCVLASRYGSPQEAITLHRTRINLTHGDVVAPGDTDGDSDHHLADLDGGDVVGLAEADLHAGESVVEVHECCTEAKKRYACECWNWKGRKKRGTAVPCGT